jgi:TonB family protein
MAAASAVVLFAMTPTAWASSPARCDRYDTSGLAAPWSSAGTAQPDDDTRWSVETGHLVRTAVRGPEEERDLGDERLLSVAFPTSDEGWTVGESGAAFHTRDGGRTWDRRPVGLEGDLRLVRCADEAHCLILANDGTLLQTADGGRQWTRTPFRAPIDVTDVHLLDPEHGFMVSGSGAFLETHDGGATWRRRALPADPQGSNPADVVRFASPRLGWVGSGSRLLRTTDGGETWNVTLRLEDGLSFLTVASADGRAVQAGVRGECSAFERSGNNLRSEDGGATWQDVVDPEESERDWEALVQDSSAASGLTHAFRAAVFDAPPGLYRAAVTDARPAPEGLRVRHLYVRERACGDVEIASREEPPWPEWAALDPCGLDAERANEVLARFADQPASDETRLFVACGDEQKTFRLPRSIARRRLGRVSPSLVGLLGLADHVDAPARWTNVGDRERNAGARDVPLLKSGLFDGGFEQPDTLRHVLDRYEGSLPPKGWMGGVTVELPAGTSLLKDIRPPYPDIALQARVEGVVVLDLAVDAGGNVGRVATVSGIPLLDTASVTAARQWVFEPGAARTVRASLRFAIDRCARGGLLFGE